MTLVARVAMPVLYYAPVQPDAPAVPASPAIITKLLGDGRANLMVFVDNWDARYVPNVPLFPEAENYGDAGCFCFSPEEAAREERIASLEAAVEELRDSIAVLSQPMIAPPAPSAPTPPTPAPDSSSVPASDGATGE